MLESQAADRTQQLSPWSVKKLHEFALKIKHFKVVLLNKWLQRDWDKKENNRLLHKNFQKNLTGCYQKQDARCILKTTALHSKKWIRFKNLEEKISKNTYEVLRFNGYIIVSLENKPNILS